ncbi:hypothetical protein KLP28_07725 [Nocardioidaceae bacterium]|nr:hypothetical protein KLP28_07725 [Nocardioidaceae bacterium]
MKTGSGIGLVAVGLILMFALQDTDIAGINFYIVGGILVAAGAIGIVLGLVERNRSTSREVVEVQQNADGTEEVTRRKTKNSDPMA